jgi:putative transposase
MKYATDILAYVIMPNHIHLILYFKEENQLSAMMRDFKKYTSGEIRRKLEHDGHLQMVENLRINIKMQKFKVWMDRFDDVFLESRHILESKLDYIHDNPVAKGYCKLPEDYTYSSAGYYEKEKQGKVKITHYMEYF